MECGRKLIYFSTYENGVKTRRSGYAGVFIRGAVCDVQIYYRGNGAEEEKQELHPVYIFRDGTVKEGQKILMEENMAATTVQTSRVDFMQSGRCLEELDSIYIDGVTNGICGGRPDGQDLMAETAYTMADCREMVTEVDVSMLQEEEEEPVVPAERWSLQECLEKFPELKLPFDGIRRKCCRMTLEDMEHLPEEWEWMKENHFLLHGYYEYHHLLLARLSCRYGERYAIGVPGEFCYRNQYMAENFGFYDFAPLEQGRRRGGSFGYWYYYLEK